MTPRFHRGFTLVEVLMASAVLAVISAGLLATTWRLSNFGRDEAEHMMADGICHDLMWAIYSQKYDEMLGGASSVDWFAIDKQFLPYIKSTDFLGRPKKDVYPLWRSTDNAGEPVSGEQPQCRVKIVTAEDGSTKTITVWVRWWNGAKQNEPKMHSNVVVRAAVDRKINVGAGS